MTIADAQALAMYATPLADAIDRARTPVKAHGQRPRLVDPIRHAWRETHGARLPRALARWRYGNPGSDMGDRT